MITRRIYFQPTWSIEVYAGVEEIVQRMGWAMDMKQDERNPELWFGVVNLPIEDEKLFYIIEDGVLDCGNNY